MEEFATLSVQKSILISWAVFCGGFDLLRRRLPNLLTLGGGTAALAMLAVKGHGWLGTAWASCLGAAMIASLLTLPAYANRLLGAGDVKLLLSMGLLGGLKALMITYVFAGLLVGLASIVWIWAYRWEAWFAFQVARIGVPGISIPEPTGRRLPFGFALAVGFTIAVFGHTSHLLDI
jgi:prepilin peptidase CpaA